MKPIWRVAFILAVCSVWALVPAMRAGDPVSSGPATVPTTRATDGKTVRDAAFKQMLNGQFEASLATLQRGAAGAAGKAALDLARDYMKVRRQADAERTADRQAAIHCTQLARLAEAHHGKLVETGLHEKLYKAVKAVAEAVANVDAHLSDALAGRPVPAVAKDLAKARGELAKAVALVGSGHGDWGAAFRSSAGKVKAALDACAKAWTDAQMPRDWRRVRVAGEAVHDALIEVGVLVARDPLTVALTHAREAKDLANVPAAEFLKGAWVKDLAAAAEKRGQEKIKAGEWYDALSVYGRGGLTGLDEDNDRYQDIVKRIEHHVRVLMLYGPNGNGTSTAATGPASRPAGATTRPDLPDDEEPRWAEMIAGMDTVMVRHAISRVDEKYVSRPDYKKMGLGALEAVKVLVETPEAAKAFAVLTDKNKVTAFRKTLDARIDQLRQDPTVDHTTVALALNRVLDLNAKGLDLPPEVITMEFAEGMLETLDEFTGMIWPYRQAEFQKQMGSFYGIGVRIRKDPGAPIEVVTPLPDTPALRAGLRAGDLITNVDGRDIRRLSIERAVKLITGPRHTKVELTVQRSGRPTPMKVAIIRDRIVIPVVKGWRRRNDGTWDFMLDPKAGVAYVRLTQFTDDGTGKIRKALRAIRKGGAKGLILDLRANPGGVLSGAVDVANEFLQRGLIVRTDGRAVPEIRRAANALGEYQDGKMVVLINRASASASEIVSGALKDWGRATIVGERTYGKGSVQGLIQLRSGRAKLKLTTAHYYLPSGRCVHRTNGAKIWGVDPHVPCPMTVRQMNRWAELRQETDLLKTTDPQRLDTLLNLQLDEDLQLQTGLLLLRLQLLDEPA